MKLKDFCIIFGKEKTFRSYVITTTTVEKAITAAKKILYNNEQRELPLLSTNCLYEYKDVI